MVVSKMEITTLRNLPIAEENSITAMNNKK